MSVSRSLKRRQYAEGKKLSEEEFDWVCNLPELKEFDPIEVRLIASLIRRNDAKLSRNRRESS